MSLEADLLPCSTCSLCDAITAVPERRLASGWRFAPVSEESNLVAHVTTSGA